MTTIIIYISRLRVEHHHLKMKVNWLSPYLLQTPQFFQKFVHVKRNRRGGENFRIVWNQTSVKRGKTFGSRDVHHALNDVFVLRGIFCTMGERFHALNLHSTLYELDRVDAGLRGGSRERAETQRR